MFRFKTGELIGLMLAIGLLAVPTNVSAQCCELEFGGCPNYHHVCNAQPPAPQFDGPIHNSECRTDFHDLCWNEDLDSSVASLVDAVKKENVDRIRSFVKRFPEVVSVNKKREAIQIRGCDGVSVVANLPLPRRVFGLVADR